MIIYRKVSNINTMHGKLGFFKSNFYIFLVLFCLDPDPYQSSVWIRISIKMIRIRNTEFYNIVTVVYRIY